MGEPQSKEAEVGAGVLTTWVVPLWLPQGLDVSRSFIRGISPSDLLLIKRHLRAEYTGLFRPDPHTAASYKHHHHQRRPPSTKPPTLRQAFTGTVRCAADERRRLLLLPPIKTAHHPFLLG